ncbi:MAG: 6-phospho-3-hexuloisomerase [Archaeoglobaceae archaeon]
MPKETLFKFLDLVSAHVNNLKRSIDFDSVERMIEAIESANSIFVMGAGRSGYVAKAFAMRLMHLGYTVYVVGEAVTPRIKAEDVLIAISGSGETTSVVNIAKKAKEMIGSKLVAVTGREKSTLADMADIVVVIRGKLKDERDEDVSRLAPLGTMFELMAMVFLDALVAEIMARKSLTEKDLEMRHAVLE